MSKKSDRELYDEIYRKFPEKFQEIQEDVSCKIDYEFIEPYYIKGEENKCVDYGKIISKIKWPDDKMKTKIVAADLSEAEKPIPFLIAGTVVKITKNDNGHKIYLSDDEHLWNDPDDYDRLLHIKETINVQHCIVAHELLLENRQEEGYSIGDIGSIRPGTRVMLTAFMVEPAKNENWLLVAFSDIESCSANVSRMREYYNIYLDIEYRLITREEYYKRFFFMAKLNSEIFDFIEKNSDSSQSEGCYIATCVYGSYDCPQVWTLRRFRDDTLSKTRYGRSFIRMYYKISPTLVKWFGDSKWFKKLWRGRLDEMVKRLQGKGVENTPYNDR